MLKNAYLEENELKIINDAIISENLTVRDIRDITKNSKLNKKKKMETEAMEQDYDYINSRMSETNHSIRQQTRGTKESNVVS